VGAGVAGDRAVDGARPADRRSISALGDDALPELEFDLICRFAEMAALALDNTEIRERLQQEYRPTT
jgi:hypothetical protein